jgi:hypothetical protein
MESLTMRNRLALTAAVTLGTLLAVGCGSNATPSPDSGPADARTDTARSDGEIPDQQLHDTARPSDAPLPGPLPVPLSACIPTVYSVRATIGSQQLGLVVDTGSTTTAVAGAGCSCGGVTPLYTPGPTATDKNQTASSVYGTGSWKGEIYEDKVTLGPATTIMNLVSITEQTGFFQPIACGGAAGGMEGLLGMGPPAVALPGTHGFYDRLVATTHLPDIFATWLCDKGGTLWLGGYDSSATTAPVQYTPVSQSVFAPFYYAVNLASITINSTSVTVATGFLSDTVVDTGSSVFLLATPAYNGLVQALEADTKFKEIFGTGFFPAANTLETKCADVTKSKAELDAALPVLTLNFGTSPVVSVKAVATEAYLFSDGKQWCTALAGLDQNPLTFPLSAIMGAPAMRSSVIVFDRVNKQIGFAPHAPCP